MRSDAWYLIWFCGKPEVLWKNQAFSIRVDQRVVDIKELEYEVRSLISGMVL
jgi:hypothetical protein